MNVLGVLNSQIINIYFVEIRFIMAMVDWYKTLPGIEADMVSNGLKE